MPWGYGYGMYSSPAFYTNYYTYYSDNADSDGAVCGMLNIGVPEDAGKEDNLVEEYDTVDRSE
jgi:hypothetical protein